MDIRALRYALTLAEELHFGRAAQAHFITPQPFGRHIQGLEREVGKPLFDRTTRRVTLTEAGEKFMPRVRRVLSEVDELVRETESDLAESHLRIGVLGYGLADYWQSIRVLLSRNYPELTFSYVDLTWEDQYDAVRTGDVDISVVHYVGGADDLNIDEMATNSRYAVVPADSDLADAAQLSMADIAEYPSVTPIGQPGLEAWRIGSTPQSEAYVRTPTSIPAAVAATGSIGVHAEPARRYFAHPDVRYVPLEGPPAISAIASRTYDRRGTVAAFRSLIRAVRELDGLVT